MYSFNLSHKFFIRLNNMQNLSQFILESMVTQGIFCKMMILIFSFLLVSLLITIYIRLKFKPKLEGICAILGSGGHTNEMIRIISELDPDLRPTQYILSQGDTLSFEKAQKLLGAELKEFIWLPRPRNVGQSYLTSIATSLKTLFKCLELFSHNMPKLLLCNGPGICVVVSLSLILISIFTGRPLPKIVYIESFARTRSLSLSGRVMQWIASALFVQWPRMASSKALSNRKYVGLLV